MLRFSRGRRPGCCVKLRRFIQGRLHAFPRKRLQARSRGFAAARDEAYPDCPSQGTPDGTFPREILQTGRQGRLCRGNRSGKKGRRGALVGTGPDADRMGIMIRDAAGEYISLSGNQIAVF